MHYLIRSTRFPSLLFQFYRNDVRIRLMHENSFNETSLKKVKLIKKLASTILFGGTFLTILWARKKKQSSFSPDMKLVKNDNFGNNTFKLYDYKGFILPSFVAKNMDSIQKFQCRENDIFVVSFPKTGTTWLQEIIYCIVEGIEISLSKTIEDRFPYLEFVYPGLSTIEKMNDQRFIKTHLPYSLLPKDVWVKQPKIFCIMRNPKDVAVSYYHFVRMITISKYSGNFFNFFEDFVSNKVPYGPIWKHYKEMWEHKADPNVLIITYEDLHQDIHYCIKKIANHLGKEISEEQIDLIAEHCSFENMSRNPNVNYNHWDDLGLRKKDEEKFMRKGQIGDWKNYFTSEMNVTMDSWIKENIEDALLRFKLKENTQ